MQNNQQPNPCNMKHSRPEAATESAESVPPKRPRLEPVEESIEPWAALVEACETDTPAAVADLLPTLTLDKLQVWCLAELAERLSAVTVPSRIEDAREIGRLVSEYFEHHAEQWDDMLDEAIEDRVPVGVVYEMLYAGAADHLDERGRDELREFSDRVGRSDVTQLLGEFAPEGSLVDVTVC
jgi:predicted TPR repeat methyltransferase